MKIFHILKKFNLILSKHQKMRVAQLVVLMIIGGFLESISVSLVLPFMKIAMNSEEIMNEPIVKTLCTLMNVSSPKDFMVIMAICIAALYIFKNLYLLLEYNIQFRFVYGNMFEMQKKLLNNYIHRPYEYFLHVNSGEIIRILNVDVVNTFSMYATLLFMLSEMVVSSMLIITVFVMSPKITTIIVIIMLFLLLIINKFVKPILKNAGIEQQSAGTGMNKWLIQSIQGIKEIKVLKREKYFQENYSVYGQQYVRSMRKYQILTITPRFLIEAFSMASMFILIGVLIYRNNDIESLIPLITAVATAAMRLLPSANRISTSLGTIAFNEPMLDKLIENLNSIDEEHESILSSNSDDCDKLAQYTKIMSCNKDICFSDVSYKYADSADYVLKDSEMKIKIGESIGIIGESGSGKTTAVDIILGLLHPEQGKILVDGTDIREDMNSWLENIGYIPQMIFMLDDSIKANIVFGTPEDQYSEEDVWAALKEASLDEFVRGLPDGLETEIGERGVRLSGGQRQRIGIARALFRNATILVFDEATSALDNATESAIMSSIERLHGKKTMIIIAHRLSTIESCDHVYKVENKKILKVR